MAFGAMVQGWMPGPAIEFFGHSGTGYGGGFQFGGYTGGGIKSVYFPTEGWDPIAKVIVAGVLDAVGYGEYEGGVFDRSFPSVPVVLPPEVPQWEPEVLTPDPDARPWPGSTTGPGWDDDEWVIPDYEDEPVAVDWGGIISGLGSQYIAANYGPQQFVGTAQGAGVPQGSVTAEGINWGTPTGGGSGVTTNALCPPAGSCGGPRYLTYDCKTGQMSVRRRRRRRALLTEGDKSDLGVIVAMFGKGAAAQIALAAAVKR